MQNPPIPRLVGAFIALAGAALLLLPARTLAQCSDPAVPRGGFAVTRLLNQPVTYIDTAKTLMDVRYPSAAPGTCGWPVIILVHGGGGDRNQVANDAEYYATQGYATVAYDVRGQGVARANPASLGFEGLGRSERLDLAEIVLLIKHKFGGRADVNRLGITGYSMGARHSWMAAAWSGRTLPATNNRGIKTFPKFHAAYPIGASPKKSQWIVAGRAFTRLGVGIHSLPNSRVVYEPTYLKTVKDAMSKGDPAAVVAMFNNDPWRQDLAYLKNSSVPVMAYVAWNDAFSPVDDAVRALDVMPKTTPTRAFLSTYGFHNEPFNRRQWQQSRVFAQRWFDRFLKGIKNQVDTEPRFVTSVVPATASLYQNRRTLLWHRYSSSWGPAGTKLLKFYLRQGQALSTQAPTTVESPETIRHRVNTGWTMAGFVSGGGGANYLTQAFVFHSIAYDTPVQKDLEIVGSPSLVLEVSPQASATDYQLHCALYHVHPNGTERYLQTGMALVKGNSNAQRLTIDFHDINAFVPAGDKLWLRIENLSRRYPAGLNGGFNYYTVPYFKDADVAIEHTTVRPSWFEIPVAKTIQPALTSATLNFDTTVPADIVFNLDGTRLLAGSLYWLVFGASGISPGTAIPGGGTALLNLDAVTNAMLSMLGTPFLPNGFGTLDQNGRAALQPRIALSGFPALGAFVGLRLNALAVVSSNNQLLASNPLDVYFR